MHGMLETVAIILSHEANGQHTENGRTERWEADIAETVNQLWTHLAPDFLAFSGSVLVALHALTFCILATILG